MTTVWAVEHSDYENGDTVAVFTNKRLAQQHARDLGFSYEVARHKVLSHRPVQLRLEYRTAEVYSDGRVEHYVHTSTRDYWDYDAPTRVTLSRYPNSIRVSVHTEPGSSKAELLRHVDTVLGWYAAAAGWSDEQLAQAKDNARWDHAPVPVSRCYRTTSGLAVHVKAGCRC